MAIYYHGSMSLFDRFDLSHLLRGDGKCKFGVGVYLTSGFRSAAHYSGANRDASTHYVYTVEVPELAADNHIDFKRPVNPAIIDRAERKLGFPIPREATIDGKVFRKFLARHFGKKCRSDFDQGDSRLSALRRSGEPQAAGFLSGIGVGFITWPYNWKNPDAGLNIAVLDENDISIIKVEQVELDSERQLIPGSERIVEPRNREIKKQS